jgi:hypothetical protein
VLQSSEDKLLPGGNPNITEALRLRRMKTFISMNIRKKTLEQSTYCNAIMAVSVFVDKL